VANLDDQESLEGYVKLFGPDDGFLVKNLTDRVSNLYDEWRLFLYLFADNKDRFALLANSSDLMFATVQRSLWDGVLSKVRHLTDPAKTKKGQRNFSLAWLKEIGKSYGGHDYSADWDRLSEDCEPVRRYVTKYIAHLDDKHIRGKAEAPLSRKTTTLAVKSIGAFVQKFHETTCNSTILLLPTLQDRDHQHVLYLLYLGQQKLLENDTALRNDWRIGLQEIYQFPDHLTEKIDPFNPF
jgi:hypothetical protein